MIQSVGRGNPCSPAVARKWQLECDSIFPGATISRWSYSVHLGRFAFLAGFVEGKDILEVGCGTGYGTSYMYSKGARRAVGVDISATALDVAREAWTGPGLEFYQMSAEELAFPDDSFDMVCSVGAIDHMTAPVRFVQSARRILRPGGIFACSVINKDFMRSRIIGAPLDRWHRAEFTPQELYRLVSAEFENPQVWVMAQEHRKFWWRAYCLGQAAADRLHLKAVATRAARILFPKDFRPITYSQDRVDTDFAAVKWRIANETSDLDNPVFIVMATKSPLSVGAR